MVRVTSARPSGGRDDVPAKTTSSILPPRSVLAPCSPMTQHKASTTLDLPDPFGPTTQVMPGSKRSVVAEAKDLNPRSVRLFRYTREHSSLRRSLRRRRWVPGTDPWNPHTTAIAGPGRAGSRCAAGQAWAWDVNAPSLRSHAGSRSMRAAAVRRLARKLVVYKGSLAWPRDAQAGPPGQANRDAVTAPLCRLRLGLVRRPRQVSAGSRASAGSLRGARRS